ncbi:MAG: hypothetical protein NWQ55_10440 [Salibacteraceae bacterium]|nr:hypothetical protein [Salibacteraceae bacterium]
MKITFKTRHFLLFLFLLLAKIGVSQNGEINIKFIGNCGMHLTDGDLNIYVDFPYKSGFFNYMEYDKVELDSIRENSIFIFTHKHPDHYSHKQMRKALRKKQGHKYGKWNLNKLQQMCDSTEDVMAFPSTVSDVPTLAITQKALLLALPAPPGPVWP